MRNRILITTATIVTSVCLSLTFVAPATSATPAPHAASTSGADADRVGDVRLRVGVLEGQMDDMEARVTVLEGNSRADKPTTESLAYGTDGVLLRTRVASLERRMDDIEARVTVLESGSRTDEQTTGSIGYGTDGAQMNVRVADLELRMVAVEARVGDLEVAGQAAEPVYAHLPYGPGISRTDWPALTRERIEDGWATGAFLYYNGALQWGPEWDSYVAEFPKGVDLMVSPKALNEAALIDFLNRLPQVFRDRLVIAYYQEPEDNHLTAAARAQFRATVVRFDELTEPYGVSNGVQMQTYVIGPAQAHGGNQTIIDMVPADNVDFFGWSLFEFNGNDSGAGHVTRAEAFMADHYAGIDWGITSLGFSVPQGTPAGSPLRAARAQHVENAMTAIGTESADASSWYDVPAGNSNRDFAVDGQLLPVLSESPWD